MSTRLLTSNIWPKVTAAIRRQAGACAVAVAFLAKGGAKRLPMVKGSVLITNFSDATVRSGLTHPLDVLRLLRKGVAVYSADNLHAKVFVAGRTAFIGSFNASTSSAKRLIEAGIVSDAPDIVRDCRGFVRSLEGAVVTPQLVKAKQRIYRPPRLPRRHVDPAGGQTTAVRPRSTSRSGSYRWKTWCGTTRRTQTGRWACRWRRSGCDPRVTLPLQRSTGGAKGSCAASALATESSNSRLRAVGA